MSKRYSSINIRPTDNGHSVQTHFEPDGDEGGGMGQAPSPMMSKSNMSELHFPSHSEAAAHASKVMKEHEEAGGSKMRKSHAVKVRPMKAY